MGLSNLPPGCSSADGGIDHDYESALESFCDIAQSAEDIRIINAIAPAILTAVHDAYKEGFNDGSYDREHRPDT